MTNLEFTILAIDTMFGERAASEFESLPFNIIVDDPEQEWPLWFRDLKEAGFLEWSGEKTMRVVPAIYDFHEVSGRPDIMVCSMSLATDRVEEEAIRHTFEGEVPDTITSFLPSRDTALDKSIHFVGITGCVATQKAKCLLHKHVLGVSSLSSFQSSFRVLYPLRHSLAATQFSPATKILAGFPPSLRAELLQAAYNYKLSCVSNCIEGTRFVMLPSTFLRKNRWKDWVKTGPVVKNPTLKRSFLEYEQEQKVKYGG